MITSMVRALARRVVKLPEEGSMSIEPVYTSLASCYSEPSGMASQSLDMFRSTIGVLRDVDYMLLVVLSVQLYVLKTLMARASSVRPGMKRSGGTFGRKTGRMTEAVSDDKTSLGTHSAAASIPSRCSANTPSLFSVPSYNNFNLPIQSQLADAKHLTAETHNKSRSCPIGSRHPTGLSKIDAGWSLLSKCSTRPLVAAVIRKHANPKGRKGSKKHNELGPMENSSGKFRFIDITLDNRCSSSTIVGDMAELETSISGSDIGLVASVRTMSAPANAPSAASKVNSKGMSGERAIVKDNSTALASHFLGSSPFKVPEEPTANLRSTSGVQDAKVNANQLDVNAESIERKELWTVPMGFGGRGSDTRNLGAQSSSQLLTLDKKKDEERRIRAPEWRALVQNEKTGTCESDLTYAVPGLERVIPSIRSECVSVNARATSEITRTLRGDLQLPAPTCERKEIQMTTTVDGSVEDYSMNVSHGVVGSGEHKDRPTNQRKQWNFDVPKWRERAVHERSGSRESSLEDSTAKRVRSDAPNWRERATDAEQGFSIQPANSRKSDVPSRRGLSGKTSGNPRIISLSVPRVEQIFDMETKARSGGAMRTESSTLPTLASPLKVMRHQKSGTLQVGRPVSSSSVEAIPLPLRPSAVHDEQRFNEKSHGQMMYRSPALLKRLGFAVPTGSAYRSDSPRLKQR